MVHARRNNVVNITRSLESSCFRFLEDFFVKIDKMNDSLIIGCLKTSF
jgi:hypothetical protein